MMCVVAYRHSRNTRCGEWREGRYWTSVGGLSVRNVEWGAMEGKVGGANALRDAVHEGMVVYDNRLFS
jgi:hypothetical protein